MIDPKLTIAQIIENNHLLTQAVRRFEPLLESIDQSIVEFCQQQHVHLEFFLEILQVFDDKGHFSAHRFKQFPTPVLLDYLKRTHFYYLHKRLFEIEQSVYQLTTLHQDSNPLVVLLSGFFKQYRHGLLQHIKLEEDSLFPYIEHLYACQHDTGKIEIPYKVNYSLKVFEALHDDEEEVKLALIREKILLYDPSTTEAFSYKVLLTQLETLETDMHIHGLLEDEVLIPKAYELELSRYN